MLQPFQRPTARLLPLRLFPCGALLACKIPVEASDHGIVHHTEVIRDKEYFHLYLPFLKQPTQQCAPIKSYLAHQQ